MEDLKVAACLGIGSLFVVAAVFLGVPFVTQGRVKNAVDKGYVVLYNGHVASKSEQEMISMYPQKFMYEIDNEAQEVIVIRVED